MLDEPNARARLQAHLPERLPVGESTRFAAVAAVLRYRADEPDVLLIRRSDNPGDP